MTKNKNGIICICCLAVSIGLFVFCSIYSALVDISVILNDITYKGLQAHLYSKGYWLVKVLLPLSVIFFICAIIFLIKYLKEKHIRLDIKNKSLFFFIIFLIGSFLLFYICFVYSRVVPLTIFESSGAIKEGIAAHLVSEHYHLVKILLPMSIICLIFALVLAIKMITISVGVHLRYGKK